VNHLFPRTNVVDDALQRGLSHERVFSDT